MISKNENECPKCNGTLKHYDTVKRIVRTKGRKTKRVNIKRLKCIVCGSVHREIPDYIFPYKQYEAELINGVLEGYITSDTLGYEDYPCEMTMNRWVSEMFTLR
ncbi:MAG: hypothetical protein IJ192_00570 [Clostridia bacterium]|nr:hypothetical protein [Clostridia bacterium]